MFLTGGFVCKNASYSKTSSRSVASVVWKLWLRYRVFFFPKWSHDEHMSGPDEELGVNEPPSGHINGKCYQTLKITSSFKAAEVSCTCWEAKWTEFLTIVTVCSQQGEKSFIMREMTVYFQFTLKFICKEALCCLSWVFLPVCRSSTWWPSLNRRPMRKQKK